MVTVNGKGMARGVDGSTCGQKEPSALFQNVSEKGTQKDGAHRSPPVNNIRGGKEKRRQGAHVFTPKEKKGWGQKKNGDRGEPGGGQDKEGITPPIKKEG